MKSTRAYILIVFLAVVMALVAPQRALSTDLKQKCYLEDQCTQYGTNCTKYEKVCLEPVNICAAYEQICVKHKKKCIEYQYEKEPVKVCIKYGKKCAEYGYEEKCQKEVQEQQQQWNYWSRRWTYPTQQAQVCKKEKVCIKEVTDQSKCLQYGTAYENIKVCVKHKKVCEQYAKGKCIQFDQSCKSYGKKCVKQEKVCLKYEKIEVCPKQQDQKVYKDEKKSYW
jgi:hypothetical protein